MAERSKAMNAHLEHQKERDEHTRRVSEERLALDQRRFELEKLDRERQAAIQQATAEQNALDAKVARANSILASEHVPEDTKERARKFLAELF